MHYRNKQKENVANIDIQVPYADIYPNYGPIIGGTNLTIIGALLGDETPIVTLQNLPGQSPVRIPCAVTSS